MSSKYTIRFIVVQEEKDRLISVGPMIDSLDQALREKEKFEQLYPDGVVSMLPKNFGGTL